MDTDINLPSQVDHKCDMFGLKTGCMDLYKIWIAPSWVMT